MKANQRVEYYQPLDEQEEHHLLMKKCQKSELVDERQVLLFQLGKEYCPFEHWHLASRPCCCSISSWNSWPLHRPAQLRHRPRLRCWNPSLPHRALRCGRFQGNFRCDEVVSTRNTRPSRGTFEERSHLSSSEEPCLVGSWTYQQDPQNSMNKKNKKRSDLISEDCVRRFTKTIEAQNSTASEKK